MCLAPAMMPRATSASVRNVEQRDRAFLSQLFELGDIDLAYRGHRRNRTRDAAMISAAEIGGWELSRREPRRQCRWKARETSDGDVAV